MNSKHIEVVTVNSKKDQTTFQIIIGNNSYNDKYGNALLTTMMIKYLQTASIVT